MVVSSDLPINLVVASLQKTGAVMFEDVGAFGDDLQTVLMELLESQVGRRAGDHGYRRILSTGLPDLYSRVEAGIFRKELFYRLNTIYINICLPMTIGDVLVTGSVSRPRAVSPH
jgi:DNA-binding NtrC family response regulator